MSAKALANMHRTFRKSVKVHQSRHHAVSSVLTASLMCNFQVDCWTYKSRLAVGDLSGTCGRLRRLRPFWDVKCGRYGCGCCGGSGDPRCSRAGDMAGQGHGEGQVAAVPPLLLQRGARGGRVGGPGRLRLLPVMRGCSSGMPSTVQA